MLEYRSRSSTLYYLLAIIIVTSTETNHPGSIIARLNFNSNERIKKGVNFKNVPFHGENRERERERVSHSRFLISRELVLSLMAKVSCSWKLVLNSTVLKFLYSKESVE